MTSSPSKLRTDLTAISQSYIPVDAPAGLADQAQSRLRRRRLAQAGTTVMATLAVGGIALGALNLAPSLRTGTMDAATSGSAEVGSVAGNGSGPTDAARDSKRRADAQRAALAYLMPTSGSEASLGRRVSTFLEERFAGQCGAPAPRPQPIELKMPMSLQATLENGFSGLATSRVVDPPEHVNCLKQARSATYITNPRFTEIWETYRQRKLATEPAMMAEAKKAAACLSRQVDVPVEPNKKGDGGDVQDFLYTATYAHKAFMAKRGFNADNTTPAAVAASREFGSMFAHCATDYYQAAEPLLIAKRDEVLPHVTNDVDRVANLLFELGYIGA